jgi:hypothetical protein
LSDFLRPSVRPAALGDASSPVLLCFFFFLFFISSASWVVGERACVTTVESFKKECCGSLSSCRASIYAEWVVIWSSRVYQGGKESNRKWSNRK